MAGAYTAKPAVVSTPDVPPGWNPSWPRPGETDITWPGIDPDPFFPAPFPPGYSPDYSIVMTASEIIAYDGTAAVTGSLRDHLTYATNEPDVIAWTATVSSSPGRSVNLRFPGDEEYANSILSDCVFGTYWGATPDIEFELTEEDTGGTIILTAKSAISGAYVGATLAIEVGLQVVITVKYELIGALGDGYYYGRSRVKIIDTPLGEWYGSVFWYVPDYAPDYWDIENERPEDEIEIETSLESPGTRGGTATVTILTVRAGETYEVNSYVNFTDCVAKVTLTITIGEDEYVFIDDEDGWATGPTIEIDGTTLEVTQTGP